MKKLIWTEPAVDDLQGIFDFISKDSEYYARIFISKLMDTTEKLIHLPEIGRMVPEYNRKDIRELIFQNYRIIYKIEEKRILILTVIHGKRDLITIKENLHQE